MKDEKMKKVKNTKNSKNEKCEIFENFQGFWLHEQKSGTISKVCLCFCIFFDEIFHDFHELLSDCVFFRRKSTTNLGETPFFPSKIDNFCWTVNNKHKFYRRKSSPFSTNYFFETDNHSRTTATTIIHSGDASFSADEELPPHSGEVESCCHFRILH